MSLILAALALVVLAGGVVAVSVQDPRLALLGLAVALVTAPFLASPEAPPLALAARVVGAILGVWLPWTVVRHARSGTLGSAPGWPAEGLAAAAGAAVGLGSHGLGLVAAGPAEAQAAAFGLVAIAIVPAAMARDALRLGIGLGLLVLAASLVRAAIATTPGALEDLATAGLLVAVLGGTAVLSTATRETPGSDAVRTEAHRAGEEPGRIAESAPVPQERP